MSQRVKLIGQVELEMSGGEIFFKILQKDGPEIPNMIKSHIEYLKLRGIRKSSIIEDLKLVEGEWGHAGSIMLVTYSIEGKKESNRIILEGSDVFETTYSFKVIEGYLTNDYKDIRGSIRINKPGEVTFDSKDEEHSTSSTSHHQDQFQRAFSDLAHETGGFVATGVRDLGSMMFNRSEVPLSNWVTWTLQYEKVSQDSPQLTPWLALCLELTIALDQNSARKLSATSGVHFMG